jgi:hypothetical protein
MDGTLLILGGIGSLLGILNIVRSGQEAERISRAAPSAPDRGIDPNMALIASGVVRDDVTVAQTTDY